MAYCSQTLNGISIPCNDYSKGGIKSVHIANYADVTDVKMGEDEVITGITMTSGAKFKTYQFRKGTSSMTQTLTQEESTGVSFVTTELSLKFTKMDATKRMEMSALRGGQLVAIVEDNNGNAYYLGKDDYVSVSAGGGNTSTNKNEENSYTLTLKDESNDYPHFVDVSVLDTVIDKE